jgi:hypothetical protein
VPKVSPGEAVIERDGARSVVDVAVGVGGTVPSHIAIEVQVTERCDTGVQDPRAPLEFVVRERATASGERSSSVIDAGTTIPSESPVKILLETWRTAPELLAIAPPHQPSFPKKNALATDSVLFNAGVATTVGSTPAVSGSGAAAVYSD